MPSRRDVFRTHVRDMKAGTFIPIFVDLTNNHEKSSFEARMPESITTEKLACGKRKLCHEAWKI